MRLHSKISGLPIAKGDTVIDFRGETAVVAGWEEPRHPGSTGRVYIADGDSEMGYYPSVYGLEWRQS